MKQVFILLILITGFAARSKSQYAADTSRVAFENEKMKVTDYRSTPGNDVCGSVSTAILRISPFVLQMQQPG